VRHEADESDEGEDDIRGADEAEEVEVLLDLRAVGLLERREAAEDRNVHLPSLPGNDIAVDVCDVGVAERIETNLLALPVDVQSLCLAPGVEQGPWLPIRRGSRVAITADQVHAAPS
jgi:hypothetical protein